MLEALTTGYMEVSEAIVRLRAVQTAFIRDDWHARKSNAETIRAGRALVASARGRLAPLAPDDPELKSLLERVRERLAPLPQGLIVEPFGPVELRGARNTEASGAARDRRDLERVLNQLRDLVRRLPNNQASLVKIEAWDRDRRERVGIEWLLVTRRNPLVWIGSLAVLLIVLRMLL